MDLAIGSVVKNLIERVNDAWEDKKTDDDILKCLASAEDIQRSFSWFEEDIVSTVIRHWILQGYRPFIPREVLISLVEYELRESFFWGVGPCDEKAITEYLVNLEEAVIHGSDLSTRMINLRNFLNQNHDKHLIVKLLNQVTNSTFYIGTGNLSKSGEFLKCAHELVQTLDSNTPFIESIKKGILTRQSMTKAIKSGPLSEENQLQALLKSRSNTWRNRYLEQIDVTALELQVLQASENWRAAWGIMCHNINGFIFNDTPILRILLSENINNGNVTSQHDLGYSSFTYLQDVYIDPTDTEINGLCEFSTYEDLCCLLATLLSQKLPSKIPEIKIVIKKLSDIFPVKGKIGALTALTQTIGSEKLESFVQEDFDMFMAFIKQEAASTFKILRKDLTLMKNEIKLLDLPLSLANYLIKRYNSYQKAFDLLNDAIQNIESFTPVSVFLSIVEVVTIHQYCQEQITSYCLN